VITSCEQVVPGVNLERGWELCEEISISLHHRLVSRCDWRKPSLPLQVGCKAELEKGPRSSWRHVLQEVFYSGCVTCNPLRTRAMRLLHHN